jgi:hypothetical protein
LDRFRVVSVGDILTTRFAREHRVHRGFYFNHCREIPAMINHLKLRFNYGVILPQHLDIPTKNATQINRSMPAGLIVSLSGGISRQIK